MSVNKMEEDLGKFALPDKKPYRDRRLYYFFSLIPPSPCFLFWMLSCKIKVVGAAAAILWQCKGTGEFQTCLLASWHYGAPEKPSCMVWECKIILKSLSFLATIYFVFCCLQPSAFTTDTVTAPLKPPCHQLHDCNDDVDLKQCHHRIVALGPSCLFLK